MLERILISKVRIKMLRQFLLNPEQEYHVRGLVRILDEEINAVRRELHNLEVFQLLESKKKGNKLFYRLRKPSLFLRELRSMIYKEEPLVISLYNFLTNLEKPVDVVLTEDIARSKEERQFDLDLIIIGEPSLQEINTGIKSIEKETSKEVRFTVMSKQDFEFRKKNRDPFLLKVIQSDTIQLVGTPD